MLCPPESSDDDALVYRAGLPVKLPPGGNLDDLAFPEARPKTDPTRVFGKPLSEQGHQKKASDASDILDLVMMSFLRPLSASMTLYLMSVLSHFCIFLQRTHLEMKPWVT